MSDPWWLQPCLDNLKDIPGGVLCSEQHCTEAQNANHLTCTCQKPYLNGCRGSSPPPNCCSYDATSPVYVIGAACYCCCGCMAVGTPVAVDAAVYKPIEEFLIGDLVYVADDPTLSKWSQKVVQFSSGTGDLGGHSTLIQVTYKSGAGTDFLLVNRAQLFLMPSRKLKRAAMLVPGQDELLMFDGTTAPIISMSVGIYEKGVHHIATSQKPTQDMNGHLILAKGVVCGDYALQVALPGAGRASRAMVVEGHDDLPEFGTKEYAKAYRHLKTDAFRAEVAGVKGGSRAASEQAAVAGFRQLGSKGPVKIPDHAEYFVSKKQALDILQNAPHNPPASGSGQYITDYLFKIFSGFYPDVTFYLDKDNQIPNAYSFLEYNKPFVVVTGGLIRTKAVKYESLALIIAHELGHLYGGEPENPHGYSCAGMADFAAIAAVIPYVWFGILSAPLIKPAIDQVTELFSYISPKNRNGLPGNTCMQISIDCRLSAMQAALTGMNLPHCAGGPLDPFLEVTGAEVSLDLAGPFVMVTFNTQVDPRTAESLGSYSFNPLVTATSVSVDRVNARKVMIRAEIQPGVKYEVAVFNVLSAKDEPMVPGKNTATFELADGPPTVTGTQPSRSRSGGAKSGGGKSGGGKASRGKK